MTDQSKDTAEVQLGEPKSFIMEKREREGNYKEDTEQLQLERKRRIAVSLGL